MVFVAARIPAALAHQIDRLAPFFKGGKSAIIRRALLEGVQIVHEAQMLTFPASTRASKSKAAQP